MLALSIHLAAAIRGYMAYYMPTNRAVDWLRTPRGLKWAIPVALVATPAYLFAMSICVVTIERGGPGYLNVLVMLFAWNALKFAVMGAVGLPMILWRAVASGRTASRVLSLPGWLHSAGSPGRGRIRSILSGAEPVHSHAFVKFVQHRADVSVPLDSLATSSDATARGRGSHVGEGHAMADTKIVFIAFAIEDQRQRDLLKGQSLHPRTPYEFIDMSVKEPYDSGWKDKVRTRIRRSHGVIALVSKNSLTSSGQKWEIQCAKEESKPLLGIWAYSTDRTSLAGVRTVPWTDANFASFIDSL